MRLREKGEKKKEQRKCEAHEAVVGDLLFLVVNAERIYEKSGMADEFGRLRPREGWKRHPFFSSLSEAETRRKKIQRTT